MADPLIGSSDTSVDVLVERRRQLAMLELVAQGEVDVRNGLIMQQAEVFTELRRRLAQASD